MALFASSSPPPTADTLEAATTAAADAILAQLPDGSSRRSLGQLPLDEEDRHWFAEWLRALDVRLTDWVLTPHFRACGADCHRSNGLFALVWLTAISDRVRWCAPSGAVWPAIRSAMSDAGRRRLFNSQGAPVPQLTDALESMCKRFKLRHAYEEIEAQQHYRTIVLQIGWTRRGIQSRLPHWLSGQIPGVAIDELTSPECKNYSPTFRKLWLALLAYRRSASTTDAATVELQDQLRDSPWVPRAWIEDVVRLARARLELGTLSDGDREPLGRATHDAAEDTTSLLALQLDWPEPDPPRFTLDFDLAHDLAETEARSARLNVDDQAVARFHRTEDSAWESTHASITVPASNWADRDLLAQLTDDQGAVLATETVSLWTDPDLELYRFVGQTGTAQRLPLLDRNDQLAPEARRALRRGDALLVLTARDLTLRAVGIPDGLRTFATELRTLWHVPHRWRRLELFAPDDDSEPIWMADADGVRHQPHDLPRWASRVYVELQTPTGARVEEALAWGDVVALRIRDVGPDVTVHAVRIGAEPYAGPDLTRLEVAVDEALLQRAHWRIDGTLELRVRLFLRRDRERRSVRCVVPLCLEGLFERGLHGAQWCRRDPSTPLAIQTARRFEWRPIMQRPGADVARDDVPTLLEGSRLIGTIRARRPRALHTLEGFGAPLTARWNRFNHLPNDRSLSLTAAVIDPGVVDYRSVAAANTTADGLHLNLALDCPIGIANRHALVALHATGAVWHEPASAVAVEANAPGESAWDVHIPWSLDEFLLLAVAYDGQRLGAWWPDRPPRRALDDLPPDARAGALHLLRWAKVPVLMGATASRAGAAPADAENIVTEHGTPASEADVDAAAEPHESWFATVRRLARDDPVTLLEAWLWQALPESDAESGTMYGALPAGLVPEQLTEGWHAVLRRLFVNWWPTPNQAGEIVRAAFATFNPTPQRKVPSRLQQLGAVDPWLATRVLAAWLATSVGDSHVTMTINIIKKWRGELADTATDNAGEQLAQTMHVDSAFINQALVAPWCDATRAAFDTYTSGTQPAPLVDASHADNLPTALQHEPFRHYFLSHLLSVLTAN